MYAFDDPHLRKRAAELEKTTHREWIYMWLVFICFVILTTLLR